MFLCGRSRAPAFLLNRAEHFGVGKRLFASGSHGDGPTLEGMPPYPPNKAKIVSKSVRGPMQKWSEYFIDPDSTWKRPLHREQGGQLTERFAPYGFDTNDPHSDWSKTHGWVGFFYVWVLGLAMWTVWSWGDYPSQIYWATQEAWIEVARREKYGLPYISPDYMPRERVLASLPSDEELGDFEPII